MKQWLPQLPPYQIRDTSIRSVTADKKKDSTAKERMQKYRNKRKSEESDDEKEGLDRQPDSSNIMDLSSAFNMAASKENELKVLEVLYNGRDQKLARKAERELVKRVMWTVDSDEEES